MKKLFIALAILINSINSYSSEVRIRSHIPEGLCEFVTQKTCKTKRNNGILRCENWHKKNAENFNSNTVVLTNSSSDKENIRVLNNNVTSRNTHMTADYFKCGEDVDLSAEDRLFKSIEERLNKLKQLYKDDLITAQEYESKKSSILQEL